MVIDKKRVIVCSAWALGSYLECQGYAFQGRVVLRSMVLSHTDLRIVIPFDIISRESMHSYPV